MSPLPTQSFNTIVTNTIAGIQGRASKLINFQQGSTLRAIVEGFAGVFLWFQAMALQVLQATRLSTSSNLDVDTFTADFMPAVAGTSSPRLGAQPATGQVTFTRFTAAPVSCFVPVGATVQSSDGTQNFAVIANTSFATYSALLGGYTLPSSVASIIVPVAAVVPGAAGNVSSAAINTITSPIVGIDTVTNIAAFVNGADQESDSALKSRFAAYILGLSRGDIYGLTASVEGAAVNVQFTLAEGYNYDGSFRSGYFFVVADDGSGSPPAAFLAAVLAAAQAVRPLGVQCNVFPPVLVKVSVSMQITTAAGYDHNTVVAQVAALVALNINSVGLGNPLPWSILASWAYLIPGVTAVSNVLLAGLSGDAATINTYRLSKDNTYKIYYQTIKAGTVIVS